MLTGNLLTFDKQKIAYHHYRNHHNKVVIIAPGFYNSKDSVLLKSLAQSLLDEYDVFVFDFRGHGKSSDLFYWTSKENEDLKVVLNHLQNKYENIGLIAFSLGAAVSINTLSGINTVNSLICVSAPCDVSKVDYKFWELDWENDIVYTLFKKEGRIGKGVRPGPFWLKKKKPLNSVKKITIPILYIHGDKDWVIKPWHSQKLYKNTMSKKKMVIFKNGPHGEYLMRYHSAQFIKLVREWFEDTLNKKKKK